MTTESGFYSIVTNNNYFYVSNTYRNTITRISPSGELKVNFLPVDAPISLAISNTTLFVQSIDFIHLYRLDADGNATTITSLRYASSPLYPSMVYKSYENLLYITNYSAGTITTLNDAGEFRVVYRGRVGISGICIAANILYFSNFIENSVYYFVQGIAQPYLTIPQPRGIYYIPDSLYICYGSKPNYGIALNPYGTKLYKNVFTSYISGNIPLTVVAIGNSIYYTVEKENVVYKDNTVFRAAVFNTITYYNASGITQSVISRNINCILNPAYNGLLNLRTVGSNPNNPIPPVTTIVGRTQGNAIPFNIGIGSTYESFKMRRKAETLKYRNSTNNPGYTLTNKELYSNVVKYGGAYKFSKARLTQLLKENNGNLPCDIGVNNGNPIVVTPPTNSGINDPTFEGYFLNPYLTYYPSL